MQDGLPQPCRQRQALAIYSMYSVNCCSVVAVGCCPFAASLDVEAWHGEAAAEGLHLLLDVPDSLAVLDRPAPKTP